MTTFVHTVKDPEGIHARPAALLVKEAKNYEGSEITLFKEAKSAGATKLMAIMSMGIKCGDEVRVEVAGGNEEAAAEGFKVFLESNL